MFQITLLPSVSWDSSELSKPTPPVNRIAGKYAALATPTSALRAISAFSASAMSGLRSIRVAGRPTGMAGGFASNTASAIGNDSGNRPTR